jgi:ribosomal protein S18 acetylase RimI-like enzyme
VVGYRTARADDVAAVLAFWASAAENGDRPADSADAVRALLARDPAALLLAVEPDGAAPAGERVVGTLVAGWDGWRAHLYRLAVASDRRGLGIARALVAQAESRFAAFGAGRVDAMVLDENDAGGTAWTALGYTRQRTWSRWVRPLR